MKSQLGISAKLVGFMLVVSVLPLLLLQMVSYRAVLQTRIDVAKANSAQILEIQLDYITHQTDHIESLAENPAWAKEIDRLPVASGGHASIQESYAALATKARIGQLLSGYSGTNFLESIDLFKLDGTHYYVGEKHNDLNGDRVELARQMALASEAAGQMVWLRINGDRAVRPGTQPIFAAIKSIYKSEMGDAKPELLGMLRINLSDGFLYDHFSALNLGQGAYLMLVGNHGRMVYHPNKALIGQPLHSNIAQALVGPSGSILTSLDGEQVLLSYLQISDKKGLLLSVVPYTTLTAPLLPIQRTSIGVLVVCVLLIAWFTRMYLHRVIHPIRDVINGFRDFQANKLAPDWRLPKSKAWIQIGDLVSWFNSFLDTVQVQRQSSLELQASEARNRSLIRTIPDMIFTLQRDGRYLDVHAGHKSLLLLPREAILNRTATELLPAVVAQQLIRAIEMAIDSRELQEFDYALEIGGKTLHFEARLMAANDDTVISIVRDITEQRQAEQELRIAATAFESQHGMLIADDKQVIVRVNRAFSEITGYAAGEAIGQTPRLLSSGQHDKAFYAEMWNALARTGAWAGEIWNKRKSGEVYPEWLTISTVKDAGGLATHYVAIFTDITSRKTAEDQIEMLAFFDPLTGLPNRRLLMDRLEQVRAASERHQRQGALLMVDLDNFKDLNDTLGHEQGDLLLQQLAKRLSSCVRECDTVARLGGDEFVVLLDQLDQNPLEAVIQVETVAAKVLQALQQPYQLDTTEISYTASIGITLFGEQLEGTVEPLKRAELAMYQAKAHGRNTLRFFDPKMQALVNSRVSMEAGLREAIATSQFLLHYQAQVNEQGQITGVEALLRWQHPKRGMVAPIEFITLAEETGIILPIGAWVLESACKQLVLWAKQPALAQLTMAVNVSAKQFHQRDFVNQILKILGRTGANPKRLKLELTESVTVTDIEGVIAKMSAIKDIGVTFSLDDFGTGYSSLSYLKRMPMDQLKIDKGFVRDILTDSNDAAIAKMVVALADSLGLTVIAEGVETEEQRWFLATMGCHNYQGYLFSRPLPLEDFEAFSRDR